MCFWRGKLILAVPVRMLVLAQTQWGFFNFAARCLILLLQHNKWCDGYSSENMQFLTITCKFIFLPVVISAKYYSQIYIFGCKCDHFSHSLEPCFVFRVREEVMWINTLIFRASASCQCTSVSLNNITAKYNFSLTNRYEEKRDSLNRWTSN